MLEQETKFKEPQSDINEELTRRIQLFRESDKYLDVWGEELREWAESNREELDKYRAFHELIGSTPNKTALDIDKNRPEDQAALRKIEECLRDLA